MSHGVGGRFSSDPMLLWLWCRLAVTALIRPLAWEFPYALGTALKKNTEENHTSCEHNQKKKKKKKKKLNNFEVAKINTIFYFTFLPPHGIMAFLGQGSNLSCSCDLSRCCSNTATLKPLEPVSQCSQDTADPVVPQ